MSNWYVEVRNTGYRGKERVESRGGEVTTRIDLDVYAQARLRKVIANAVSQGRTIPESKQAELVEYFKWEVENVGIKR
jgi:hypothetical protein